MRKLFFFLVLVALAIVPFATTSASPPAQGSSHAKILEINQQLRDMGMNIMINEVNYFTIGAGRPSDRILQQPFRWVPNDPRRAAQGIDLTYLVDQNEGRTASGLSSAETEGAIDRSMTTWNNYGCLSTVNIVKRPDPNQDPDIYDWFYGYGTYGNPFYADIVNAGWYSWDFFEAVGGPGGGDGILAFSVSFIFTDDDGNPTDINGDNYLDTALNEVYYNDTFGQRHTYREGNPWGINADPPGIDVETVSLHENGHSFGLGHFGPPPDAIMNPVYAGIRQAPLSTDGAGMCADYGSWPNP